MFPIKLLTTKGKSESSIGDKHLLKKHHQVSQLVPGEVRNKN